MLKLIILPALFTGISLLSCNDNEKSDENALPSEEKQIRDQISLYPDSLALRNKLVSYFADNTDYNNAIKETNIMLQKDSNNADIWDTKGRLLFLNEDTSGAINAYEKAIEIFPDPQYIIAIGTLYAQTINPLALAMSDALLQAPKANASLQAMFIKGLYYSYAGDKAKAIPFFDKCLSIDYTFMDAYREKAIALYDTRKYEDALLLLQKATTVQKTFDEAWYWMGRCYEKLNKNKEAAESYRLALQIDPDYVEAKDALAKMGISP